MTGRGLCLYTGMASEKRHPPGHQLFNPLAALLAQSLHHRLVVDVFVPFDDIFKKNPWRIGRIKRCRVARPRDDGVAAIAWRLLRDHRHLRPRIVRRDGRPHGCRPATYYQDLTPHFLHLLFLI